MEIEKIRFKSVDSTNRIAMELAKNGAKEGTLIIAKCQENGKGRLGRSFCSPEGGIYMSLILRPQFDHDECLLITAAAAVAVSIAAETVSGRPCQIKWVNDVYLDSKKVCGILTQGSFDSSQNKLDYCVLGVGINVCISPDDFSDDIKETATSIYSHKVSNDVFDRITDLFSENFTAFYSDIKSPKILNEYRKRSFLDGKTVEYQRSGKKHIANVLGIDENFRLRVIENGREDLLSYGEVTLHNNSLNINF